ncbi:MAG TPA: two-component regulator propeller domain-containing protein [Blastocatellia bacterium]|nr:two-component regulator propeller domain-containing protein [Blastocatellia bacterium]
MSIAVPAAIPNDSTDYLLDVWTIDNGLPQNSVNAIVQTKDGYLWLATFDGLVRYDGVKFVVFNVRNTPGISSNRVTALLEDPAGDLWIGTEDVGLIRYHDGKFSAFNPDSAPRMINDLQTDDSGQIVVVTETVRYRVGGGGLTPITPETGERGADVRFTDMRPRPFGLAGDRLVTLANGRHISVTVPANLIKEHIVSAYVDRRGATWVSTLASHLVVLTDRPQVYTVPFAVNSYFEDREGNLWLGTMASQLVKFSHGVFQTYAGLSRSLNSLINLMYEDREGTIWIGTNNHGLGRLRRRVVTPYAEESGITGQIVYPIFEDRAGNLWLGARDLIRFRDGVFRPYSLSVFDPARRVKLRLQSPRAIFEDDQQRLWVGTEGPLFSLQGGELVNQSERVGHWGFVWVIYEDRERNMWFGTSEGLIKYRNGTSRLYTRKDGLAGDDIKAILEDRQGVLWVATYDGLSRLQDGRFTSFTERDGLASNRVRSLYEDREGVLWIGTYDGGLSRLKDGKFTSYSTEDGLFNNGVFQILEDDRGNLWMSCNRGIYRVAKQQLNDFSDGKTGAITCVSYGKEDGMRSAECNGGRQPAGVKARDGKLWFPTQDGVVVIDPQAVPLNRLPPPVRIESVLLDRKAVDFNHPVKVQPGEENLEIHFTAPTFLKPEHVHFKYMLQGVDTDWVDAGERRVANYSHVRPGSYTFKVIAANSDGVWNEVGASFRLTVVPPFWQRWWFVTLCALAVAAAAFLAYRQRVVQLEKRNALQAAFSRQLIESQENERMRIATELHDGLGQNLLVIKNRALLALTRPADEQAAINQLGEISTMASQAISEVRTIARNLRPYQLDRLGLTMAIESIVSTVAPSSTIKFSSEIESIDNLLSATGEINLYRIVQEAVNNIVKHSHATEARIAVKRIGDTIHISIRDNGSGFNVEEKAKAGGLGLLSLSERARILGGRIDIQSAPAQGTAITLKFNLPEDRSNGHHEQG